MSFDEYYKKVSDWLVCNYEYKKNNIEKILKPSLEVIEEFYKNKESAYECALEIGISYICG